eukprot:m.73902 g.73902  ORF g.73902 m.73902 type:complete len:59 (-) comp8432_c2_seq3:3460-3636(-)
MKSIQFNLLWVANDRWGGGGCYVVLTCVSSFSIERGCRTFAEEGVARGELRLLSIDCK